MTFYLIKALHIAALDMGPYCCCPAVGVAVVLLVLLLCCWCCCRAVAAAAVFCHRIYSIFNARGHRLIPGHRTYSPSSHILLTLLLLCSSPQVGSVYLISSYVCMRKSKCVYRYVYLVSVSPLSMYWCCHGR